MRHYYQFTLFGFIISAMAESTKMISKSRHGYSTTKSENPFENIHYWLDKINGNPSSSWKVNP